MPTHFTLQKVNAELKKATKQEANKTNNFFVDSNRVRVPFLSPARHLESKSSLFELV